MAELLVPRDAAALKRNNFDALRLAMAMLVVWSHCFALWWGSEDDEPLSRLLGGIYNSGSVAVLGFFTISGFLITLSWTRSSSWTSYLAKRIRRIFPGYLAAVLLCSLVVVPLYSSRAFGQFSGGEAWGLASNLLLKGYILPSDAFGGGSVNGALWSIPYEFWCYLGVMALGLTGMLRIRWLCPVIAIAVMAVRVWLDMTGRRPGGGWIDAIVGYPYFWFMVLPSFMWGATVYQYREHIPRSGLAVAAAVLLTIVSAHLPLSEPLHSVLARLLLPPVLAYATFYVAFDPRVSLHGAAAHGDFSYGTYLYAFPIQRTLAASLKGVIAFPVYILLALALSLAAGAASWHLLESRFVRVRSRKARPLDQEAAIVAP